MPVLSPEVPGCAGCWQSSVQVLGVVRAPRSPPLPAPMLLQRCSPLAVTFPVAASIVWNNTGHNEI